MIENETNEITLIFHSNKEEDKKMRAFVETISTYKVKYIDLKRESITETQLAEVANKMNATISDLVDDSYTNSIGKINGSHSIKAMSEDDILVLIRQNPQLLITPIMILGYRAYPLNSAFEIIKEVFNIDGVASIKSANREERR